MKVFGALGEGPSWLVLVGASGGVLHVAVGPNRSSPREMRLTSSLHSGPFLVAHSRLVVGSKAKSLPLAGRPDGDPREL